VLSDVIGVSGRAIIAALIAGASDPEQLAARAHPRLKTPPERLREALRGRVMPHHRFLLRRHLQQIDALEAAITAIEAQVEGALAPLRAAIRLLDTIPGVNARAAAVIVAAIGLAMSRFPTAGHLLAWAGLGPRHDASAGRRGPHAIVDRVGCPMRRSKRLRTGAPWLTTILVQWAWAASRKTQSSFQAQFRRRRARRGAKKAICAVAASILTAADHRLKTGTFDEDLGADHFQRRSQHAQTQRLLRRRHELGYAVEITPLPRAA
jgi:transposase